MKVFGLFKSASQRAAGQLQVHVNALKGIDESGLGALALYCSYVRLNSLDAISTHIKATPSAHAKSVDLYYRPLVVNLPFVEGAIDGFDRSLLKIEQKRRESAYNPAAQGAFGLLAAATQTWRNTWLGCLHGEVRYLCREMWGLISIGFPAVSTTAWTLANDPQFNASPSDIKYFEAALRDGPDGPDYLRIPEGFEPLNR